MSGRRPRLAAVAFLPIVALACFWLRPLGPLPEAPLVGVAALREDVAFLADDARAGRGLGSAGLEEAARYLSEGFRAAGFAPAGPDDDYLQPFDAPVAIELARAELASDPQPLVRGRDFEAFLASGNGSGTAELVFAGYGISHAEGGFDEYDGLDASGRAVLLLDHRPERGPGGDGADPATHASRFLSRAYKIANARDHGARVVLLAPSSAEAEGLPGGAGAEPANPTLQSVGLPVFAVSRAAAEQLIARGGGPSLAERQAHIESHATPASSDLGGVRIRYAVEVERIQGRIANVVAVRHGSDPDLAREVVVVGAHYDHLGLGRFGSLAPDRFGEVHNGADDNASGAGGLLALARLFARTPAPRRSLVLIGFTGEEAGLLGSSHYVENSGLSDGSIVAMVNLDMIGRPGARGLTVFGTDTSPDFERLVRRAAKGIDLEVHPAEGGFGPSDQTPFYAHGIPVLSFFTGVHPDYHTPDDDLEKLDLDGSAEVLRLAYRVTATLLDAPRRPRLQRAAGEPPRGRARGYGPYLGTIPEFGGAPVRGVRLSGVRAGSPAEMAGIRAGDVIVEFDGASVATLEEFAALLFAARPGRAVEIVVMREGHRIPVTAVLGQRR